MPQASTNETASAAAGTLSSEFTEHLNQGQELWNQIVTWLTE